MTGSIRNFEKLNFTPKLSVFCSSQGQTSKYDRMAQMNLTRDQERYSRLPMDFYLNLYAKNVIHK